LINRRSNGIDECVEVGGGRRRIVPPIRSTGRCGKAAQVVGRGRDKPSGLLEGTRRSERATVNALLGDEQRSDQLSLREETIALLM
jgi:hypothetical protein